MVKAGACAQDAGQCATWADHAKSAPSPVVLFGQDDVRTYVEWEGSSVISPSAPPLEISPPTASERPINLRPAFLLQWLQEPCAPCNTPATAVAPPLSRYHLLPDALSSSLLFSLFSRVRFLWLQEIDPCSSEEAELSLYVHVIESRWQYCT